MPLTTTPWNRSHRVGLEPGTDDWKRAQYTLWTIKHAGKLLPALAVMSWVTWQQYNMVALTTNSANWKPVKGTVKSVQLEFVPKRGWSVLVKFSPESSKQEYTEPIVWFLKEDQALTEAHYWLQHPRLILFANSCNHSMITISPERFASTPVWIFVLLIVADLSVLGGGIIAWRKRQLQISDSAVISQSLRTRRGSGKSEAGREVPGVATK